MQVQLPAAGVGHDLNVQAARRAERREGHLLGADTERGPEGGDGYKAAGGSAGDGKAPQRAIVDGVSDVDHHLLDDRVGRSKLVHETQCHAFAVGVHRSAEVTIKGLANVVASARAAGAAAHQIVSISSAAVHFGYGAPAGVVGDAGDGHNLRVDGRGWLGAAVKADSCGGISM